MTDKESPFVVYKVKRNVSLAPCHIGQTKLGIEEEFNSLLMKYSEELKGIILSFSNVQLDKPYGHIINEMPSIHCKVLADALVFQPTKGMVLKGLVNNIGSNHIGMLFYGVFNGSVAASELPKGFVHNYSEDSWLDADGSSICLNDTVEVQVVRVHVAGGMISIEASMSRMGKCTQNMMKMTTPSKKKEVIKSNNAKPLAKKNEDDNDDVVVPSVQKTPKTSSSNVSKKKSKTPPTSEKSAKKKHKKRKTE